MSIEPRVSVYACVHGDAYENGAPTYAADKITTVGAITDNIVVLTVFAATYLGMAVGRVPGLAIDRTGITLSALIILLLTGIEPIGQLASALELPTLLLLFALMLVAAHFELARGFDWIAHHLIRLNASPRQLLALVIVASGVLSSVLVNDIVVFALAPMLCHGLAARGLDPRPYLLGLAAAANAGSAATLIGNPQNILIGQAGGLDFPAYSRVAVIPAAVTLVVIYLAIAWVWRGALDGERGRGRADEPPALDRWLIGKSVLAIVVLIGLLATVDQRAAAGLGVAGVLLWSRRLSTRSLLAAVDGALLVMIGALFVVTGAVTALPAAAQASAWLQSHGVLSFHIPGLAAFSLLASNTIGNVPAVVLLLKAVPHLSDSVLYGLALFSTLAGNLLITGSLANIIVAERSAQCGVRLGFMDFARVGVPVTLMSMAFAAAWLWALGVLA